MEVMSEEEKGFKRTEVGLIPEDWEVKVIDQLTTRVGDGIHATPNYDESGPYYFINGNNLSNGSIIINESTKKVSEDEFKIHKRDLFDGTILISINGTIGNVAFYRNEPVLLGKSAAYLNLSPNTKKEYLFYQLQTDYVQEYFYNNLTGTTIKNLGLGTIRNTPIPLPPTLTEQQAIASALSDVDELIRSIDGLIQKKQAIKKGTLQELLTGKKRLTGFDGEWEVKKLGDVADCFAGGTPLTSNRSYYGGEINFITSSDLNSNWIKTVENKITKDGLVNSSAKEVKSDTLLLALYGATAGVAAITEIDGAINQAVLAILPISTDKEFLFYNLRLQREEIIEKYTQGGQPNLSGKIVKSIELSFPSIEEQKAIAQILSDMVLELQTLHQKREKFVQIKQGMMQELLTGRTRLV